MDKYWVINERLKRKKLKSSRKRIATRVRKLEFEVERRSLKIDELHLENKRLISELYTSRMINTINGWSSLENNNIESATISSLSELKRQNEMDAKVEEVRRSIILLAADIEQLRGE